VVTGFSSFILSDEPADGIVAVVNDDVITQSDVERALEPLKLRYRDSLSGEELTRKLAEARSKVINNIIEGKLILREAEKAGLTVSDEEVDAKIKDIQRSVSTPEEFEEALEHEGYTINKLKKKYREQILTSKFFRQEIFSKVAISPHEITDYYKEHPDDLNVPEEIRVRQIVLRREEGKDSEVQDKVNEVMCLLNEGRGFEEVEAEFSEGTDLGWVKRGKLDIEVEKVVFNLPPGEYSEPVNMGSTCRIFKVEEKRDATMLSFSEAQPIIESKLRERKAEEKFNAWIGKLKESAYISIK
jgi:parvulin-like peptidyl-prolyl isomerase